MNRVTFSAVLCLSGLLLFTGRAEAQTASITGQVIEQATTLPLEAASIFLTTASEVETWGQSSDEEGRFRFSDLAPGSYKIVVSFLGFETYTDASIVLAEGQELVLVIELLTSALLFDEVLVQSVSRRSEKIIDAPAGVSVIRAEEIEVRPVLSPYEHIIGLPGVDVATTGMNKSKIAVRGFNNVVSSFDKLLVLIDNRNTSVPSLRHNLAPFMPTINTDISSMEIVRGPGSALYGPNAANGVLHVITKSPFESAGTFLEIGAGQQDLYSISGRHAMVISPKIAFKVSGQYYEATDWNYDDPNEPDSLQKMVATVDGPKLVGEPISNERDNDVRNIRAEARVDIRPDEETSIVISGSYADMKNINLSDVGAIQNGSWKYSSLQARMSRNRFFAQAYFNRSNGVGESNYLRRSGDILYDKSVMYAAQAQHSTVLNSASTELTYGIDLFHDIPDSDGTVNGRFEDDDAVTLVGGYAQANIKASDKLSFVAAARLDKHSRLDSPFFSPRAAAVFTPSPGHSIRMTYNRAFTTPSSNQLFIDLIIVQSLGPLPYGVQAIRTPETGFHFNRGDGGGVDDLFMQSPFNPGGRDQYIPADATEMWDTVVGFAALQGIDLSGIPTPTSDDVSTDVAVLNASTFEYDTVDPESVIDIPEPKPGITNTIEMGYKGALSDHIYVEADFYYTRIENLVSLLDVQTPNVLLNEASLQSYLASYMDPEFATAVAEGLAAIPLGTLTPVEAVQYNPADILMTYRLFDEGLDLYGSDIGIYYSISRDWTVNGSYSIVNENLFEKKPGQFQDIALNGPKNKVGFGVNYINARSGIGGTFRFRWVDEFPVRSGVYIGTVDAYSVVDVTASIRLPFAPQSKFSVSVQNLFDNEHREYVGAPLLGRLTTAYLSYSF